MYLMPKMGRLLIEDPKRVGHTVSIAEGWLLRLPPLLPQVKTRFFLNEAVSSRNFLSFPSTEIASDISIKVQGTS